MATYGIKSTTNLLTAERDLQIIFSEVVKDFDNIILYGHRSEEEQLKLFSQGRFFIDGKWLIGDSKKIVTYCDGTIKKSEHNYSPSRAVDALPYPINGQDVKRIYYFAGVVMGITKRLKEEGEITHDITWGGDWDRDTEVLDQTFFDLAHFQIIM